MKKLLIVVYLMLVALPVAANVPPPTEYTSGADCVRRLIAGQNIDVGRVELEWLENDLLVSYIIEDPDWRIKEVHFGWWHEQGNLPAHAVPGDLQYGREDLDTTLHSFTISKDNLCTFSKDAPAKCEDRCPCWFAAHAVVERPCPEEKTIYKPGRYATSAKIKVTREGRSSFFNVQIQGSGINAAVNNGWCLDKRLTLPEGIWLDAEVIYDWQELDGIVDFPQNMALIEWIARQNYVGRKVFCGQIVQRIHVQNAIWNLAHGKQIGCVASAIVSEARRHANSKNIQRSCWEMAADFVLTPRLCSMVSPPDGFACAMYQPIYSYKYVRETCPTDTPTPSETPTRTATPTRTITPTFSATSTATSTPTGTPPPTLTPSFTPTATPTETAPPTSTPTATSTPSPCPPQRETAWAFGSVEFGIGWGWFFECCEGE